MAALKIAVVGDTCVGKSAIVAQFVTKKFIDAYYIPTISNTHQVKHDMDGKVVDLNIYDTAGSDEHESLTNATIANCDCVIVVYNITSRNTFNNAKRIIQQIQKKKKLAMVIVGTKLDLEVLREVPYSEGDYLAKENNCPFMETTATDTDSVISVFNKAIKQAEQARELAAKEAQQKRNSAKCCTLI